MKYRSRQTLYATSRATLGAACLSLLLAPAAHAQGDLTGGLGQFAAVQPKKPKVVVAAKPKPPTVKKGPRATKNDRLLEAAGRGDSAAVVSSVRTGADVNTKSAEGCAALVYVAAAETAAGAQELLSKGAD